MLHLAVALVFKNYKIEASKPRGNGLGFSQLLGSLKRESDL